MNDIDNIMEHFPIDLTVSDEVIQEERERLEEFEAANPDFFPEDESLAWEIQSALFSNVVLIMREQLHEKSVTSAHLERICKRHHCSAETAIGVAYNYLANFEEVLGKSEVLRMSADRTRKQRGMPLLDVSAHTLH